MNQTKLVLLMIQHILFLKDRAYEIAINRNYDGYERTLARMVYKAFDEKTGSGVSVDEQIAEELHEPVIKKFERKKGYRICKDNIQAADLTEMGSLSPKNKNQYIII